MSRIGKLPISVPSGVDVAIEGQTVTVKGPKGALEHTVTAPITVTKAEDGSLEGLTSDDAERAQVSEFSAVTVEPGGIVNLAADDQEGIPVEGDFGPGDSLAMTVQLSGGQAVSLDVPVVHNCYEYAGIDGDGGECEVAEPAGEH